MNSTYEFTLKERPKVKMANFLGTKNWRKILEGLKRKVGIFIGTKNIFNPVFLGVEATAWLFYSKREKMMSKNDKITLRGMLF
jgi:hypothetical protein